MLKAIQLYLQRRKYAAIWANYPIHADTYHFGTFWQTAIMRHRIFNDCVQRAKFRQQIGVDLGPLIFKP